MTKDIGKKLLKYSNHRTNLPQITEQIFHKSPKITKKYFGQSTGVIYSPLVLYIILRKRCLIAAYMRDYKRQEKTFGGYFYQKGILLTLFL